MQVWKLSKLFFGMFMLRAKPSDVPYSTNLLLFLSIVFLLTKSAIYMWFIHIINRFDTQHIITLSYFASLIISVLWILILFAALRTTLLYYNKVERFIQTATSFVAMDCLLSAFFLLWMSSLALIELPLQSYSVQSIGILLGFVLMMYWQFMIYIQLLTYSMDVSILKAGVFALCYMLVQNNLSELLLNVVINVTTK